ncbi:MAG: hypothetical protein VX663_08720 [Pseudomonadota bacterium]|nr:hypothetical protein [Pseudomonadota bacterium]
MRTLKRLGAALIILLHAAPALAEPFDDAMAAFFRGDYQYAVEKLRSLAESGSAAAQYNLGRMYYIGEGVAEDHAEAVKWYRMAAEQGDARGCTSPTQSRRHV